MSGPGRYGRPPGPPPPPPLVRRRRRWPIVVAVVVPVAMVAVTATIVGVFWTLFEATSPDGIDTGGAPVKRQAWAADLDVGASSKEAVAGEVVQRAELDIEVDPSVGPLWLAGGGIEVATNHAVVSLDSADPEKQRWRATVGSDDCAVDKVAAKGSLVLALSYCENDDKTVATAYGAGSGDRKWQTTVQAGPSNGVSLLSASPPAVTIEDDDIDKPTTVVGCDPRTGKERMRVKAELDDGSPLDPEPDNVAFAGHAMVVGGSGSLRTTSPRATGCGANRSATSTSPCSTRDRATRCTRSARRCWTTTTRTPWSPSARRAGR